MRILTVRQPWAWAIIHGGKDPIPYKGALGLRTLDETTAARVLDAIAGPDRLDREVVPT